MNFRLRKKHTIILMSLRKGAPYADRIEENGKILVYEGHDQPRYKGGAEPKTVDQPDRTPNGRLTQNGLFLDAARRYKSDKQPAELVRVYEKIKSGIWTFNGVFRLLDGWKERSGSRDVYKFRLELIDAESDCHEIAVSEISHDRIIPSDVKLEVWKRDKGQCVKCQKADNLHFDHVLPFAKGGTSLLVENIQLLCARHNLEKRDKIQ